jgi:hypothetical protein
MLSDANPMVVANALAALQEIQEVSGKEVLQITSHTLFKLLAALNECTEWGQVRTPGQPRSACAAFAGSQGRPPGARAGAAR